MSNAQEKKVRYIERWTHFDKAFKSLEAALDFTTYPLHLIEHSAYLAIQAENEKLKSKLTQFEGMTFSENAEISKLKEANKKLREGLRWYLENEDDEWFCKAEDILQEADEILGAEK